MTRVKRGITTHAYHKKLMKHAKGYYGRRKNTFRAALQAVEKGWQYAYRDRRTKKRNMHSLWIQRINAAVRMHGLKYSVFMGKLRKAQIDLNCKMLAEMAYRNDPAFQTLIEQTQKV